MKENNLKDAHQNRDSVTPGERNGMRGLFRGDLASSVNFLNQALFVWHIY